MAQLAAALAVGATDQRLEAGGNLNKGERLAQIVIGAEPKPFDPLAERIARGEDQHRLVVTFIAPFAQDIETVDAGQRQIEDDRVIGSGVERGFSSSPRVNQSMLKPILLSPALMPSPMSLSSSTTKIRIGLLLWLADVCAVKRVAARSVQQ